MIFSFGDLNVDFLWTFPVEYEFTQLPDKGNFSLQLGGVAFNFAKFSNQFGETSCVIGKVGKDLLGKFILQQLKTKKIKHRIVEDENSQTGVISHFSFTNSNNNRFMTHNISNANHNISIKEVNTLNIDFKPKDILFLTGYSLFNQPVDETASYIISKAQEKSSKIVFDLVPHQLEKIEAANILRKKLTNTFKKPADIFIGEFRTWNYLLFDSIKPVENPTIEDLKKICKEAKHLANFICIRFGYQNCSKEALFFKDQLLYIKDTGYETLNIKDRIGFSEKLTVSIMQQFFLGRHTWLYKKSTKFTTPLSILEMLPKDISKDSRILDIGCGYGRAFESLKQRGFKNISGSDTSISMVNKARNSYPNLDIIHGSVKELKRKEYIYDICLLLGVLTTIQRDKDIIELLDDITSILDVNGLLLISDFLLNDDEKHLKQYEKYKSLFPDSDYGLFISQNGTINRHFHKNFIYHVLKKKYLILDYREENFKTINNNLSKGFMILCKKI